jgi:hypothetical protein
VRSWIQVGTIKLDYQDLIDLADNLLSRHSISDCQYVQQTRISSKFRSI